MIPDLKNSRRAVIFRPLNEKVITVKPWTTDFSVLFFHLQSC